MHNEYFTTNKMINKFKIALLSDIHYYPEFNQKIFDKLIRQIKNNQPDYIAIIGDILDSTNITNLDKLINFFKELANLAPVLIVLGNHDEKSGFMGNWSYQNNLLLIKELNQIENIHYLNDTTWTDKNITFYGFNLSYTHFEKFNESYRSFCEEVNTLKCDIPSNTYNITLFHSPINIYNFIKENKTHNLNKSDLILSGHMHNGCLPFIISHPLNKIFKTSRGLISPARTLFPKYAQGRVYEVKDGFIYEGVTKLSNSTKLFHKFDFIFQKKVEFLTIEQKNNKI